MSATTSTEISVNELNPSLPITQDFLKNEISTLISELNDIKMYFSSQLEIQKQEIIEQLTKENILLKSELSSLQEKDQKKTKLITLLEKDVVDLQQYIRRNNVEICGIPDSIEQKDLEQTVIKIAESIGVDVYEDDIEACHRLKSKNSVPQKTIVRFVNRRTCEALHTNKFKLKETKSKKNLAKIDLKGNIYINANLSPYNRFLWGKCKKLYNDNKIDRFWVYNGNIFIIIEADSEKLKITHLNDLESSFPDYEF